MGKWKSDWIHKNGDNAFQKLWCIQHVSWNARQSIHNSKTILCSRHWIDGARHRGFRLRNLTPFYPQEEIQYVPAMTNY